MIGALLLALAPALQGAPQLTAELIVDHPGLRSGDFDAASNAWLGALEAAPDAPIAGVAARALALYQELSDSGLSAERLAQLWPRVTDAEAALVLRQLLLEEARRRRFSDAPFALDGDLFADCLRQFHVLGPLGRLDATAPLYEADAQVAQKLPASVTSAWGTTLGWTALERARNQSAVYPGRVLYPDDGGSGWLLAFVRPPAASGNELQLEVISPNAFEAYWNGVLALSSKRDSAAEQQHAFRALVRPTRTSGAFDAVLVRFELADAPQFAVRVLDAAGRALTCEEPRWDGAKLPAWTPAAATDVRAAPAPSFGSFGSGPFEQVLGELAATLRGRSDVALAAPEPTDARALPAYLHTRHLALAHSAHLPPEIERQLAVAVEERLQALGVHYASVDVWRVHRAIDEDKPSDALALCDELLARRPESALFAELRASALQELDATGALGRAFVRETAQRHPGFAPPHERLMDAAHAADDDAAALAHGLRAFAAHGGSREAEDTTLALAARLGDDSVRKALERWHAEEPGNERPLTHLVANYTERRELAEARKLLEERIAAQPSNPEPLLMLATWPGLAGDPAAMRACYERALALDPGREEAHAALARLGVPDEAEEFFEAFAPDREQALAVAGTAKDASTALVLDSGIVFVRPDGSVKQRTHAIHLALDRKGTEILHEEQARPGTLVAQVLDKTGTVYEPLRVEGKWVWPSLDAGDSVEQVYDTEIPGRRGAPPQIGGWHFASFEQPFVVSRYVVFVPDGLPGAFRSDHFAGSHEEVRWHGGTAHVFLERGQPRHEAEPFAPSYEELLPWVQYGADDELEDVVAHQRRVFASLSAVAADLRPELEALVAAVAPSGDDLTRARALYAAVAERVLSFEGGGDTTDVWTERQGNPVGLLAALFEIAGIGFDWAVLQPPVAPELDPEPVVPFLTLGHFGLPVLRLATKDESGERAWLVVLSQGRGTALGMIPDRLAGARALVVLPQGFDWDALPRASLAEDWSLDVEVTHTVDADGNARSHGVVRVTGAGGAMVREQIAQVEPEQRSQVARNIVSSAVAGLDLASSEFERLEERGAPLALAFEGTIPGFARGSADARECLPRLPPMHLSTSFGPAERDWPLAFRNSGRTRARVRIELPHGWTYAFAPESTREVRDGFRYELGVDREAGALELVRTVEIRGLSLPAAEVAPFLRRAKELEDLETTPLKLVRG